MQEKSILPENLFYQERITEIRQHLINFIESSKVRPYSYFTSHYQSYAQAIENNLHLILQDGETIKLSDKEKFFLLSSAWLHHLGLLDGIFPEDVNSPQKDLIRRYHHVRAKEL